MEDNFNVTKGFKGYVSKADITELSPNYLVVGSANVIIDYASRVVSRLGYILFGAAATDGATAIVSSYEWDTSTGRQFPIRTWGGRWEFWWNSTWNTLKTGFATSSAEWAKVWDDTEKIDVLLGVIGDTNMYKWSGGVAKIASSTAATVTKQGVLSAKTTIGFVAGDGSTVNATITDSANGFVTAGFVAGDTLYVTGSTGNSRNFTIASVTADTISLIMSDVLTNEVAGPVVTIHNGEPTWAASRFLTTGTRKITYQGIDYMYTGGETTDTLTGLTAFPTATAGDVCWQPIIVLANPGAITTDFKQDMIAVELNQVVLASSKSRNVYISKTTSYTDFTLTSPRAPADPAKVTMDDYATCLVPMDNPQQTSTSLIIGAGTSNFFQLNYKMSQDNVSELVRVIKLHTAAGSGLLSKDAICPVKRGTVYISREPALDSLGNIEAVKGVPISDPIKNDFDTYNFTNAHVRYWKRSIYIALPAHGLVLIYDMMRNMWQPPQTIPVSRLAIIGDWLYGHSSITNETYKLFVGTNDNGLPISCRARFAYNNGGRRDRLKNMSEYWTDGYITPNAELTMNQYYGFGGALGVASMSILGSDTDITTTNDSDPLGAGSLGSNPLGGAVSGEIFGLPGSDATMVRFWQADTLTIVDYTEQFTEYVMDTLDGQFAIVSHGSDQVDAGTSPITHKK